MSSQRTLSSLRHLCSLGLPAEMLLPQFLATLAEAVPADVSVFVRHGDNMMPRQMLTDCADVRRGIGEFQQFLRETYVPMGARAWEASKAAVFSGQPNPLNAKILGYIEHEVRRPLGVPHEALRFLPNPDGQPASISLWRGGRRGYSAAEHAFLKSACAYLNYALAAPAAADPALPMLADGLCGVILLDARGTVLQADEHAEHLMALAADAAAGRDFRADERVATLLRRLCHDLTRQTAGRAGAPPQQLLRNPWGLFALRASWLQRPDTGSGGIVAATVTLHMPRRLKLWRALHALRLPPRQQEVALLFVEGMSQNDIAARLGVARTTVIDHIRRLYDRLGIAADRAALREWLDAHTPA